MHLLTKTYVAQNKWLALLGSVFGLAGAAVVHFLPLVALAVPMGMVLLNFPYVAKGLIQQMLRLGLIGLYVSSLLMYGGRWFLPLTIVGMIGCAVFGSVVFCLRYRPPADEPSQTT